MLTEMTSPKARSRSNSIAKLVVDESKLHIPDDHRLMTGWMTKQGGKWKSWKKRWFVLTPRELRYYEKEDEKTMKGTVPIDEITYAERNFTEKTNCVAIGTVGRVYLVAAESAVDFEELLNALQAVIFVPPVPRDPIECFQLWREAFEQGHRPTMSRLLDPARAMPRHSFDALYDIGVPCLDEMLFPPISCATADNVSTIVISERRYSTTGTVVVARASDGTQHIVSESWQAAIQAHLAINAAEVEQARAGMAGAAADEGDDDDEESS
eukprot:Amastigsp_a508389_369.p2 type:complete len:268 gc:universal Amastigsp_a508389_369:844-1647(+)